MNYSSVIIPPPPSNTSNNSSAEEAIFEDTKKYDEELLRMVQNRKRKGAKRGKIAWLMRLDRVFLVFHRFVLLEQFTLVSFG
jgi:hypothetical protein